MKTLIASAHLSVQPAVVASLSESAAAEYGEAQVTSARKSVRSYARKAAFVLLALGGSFLSAPALAQQTQPVTVEKSNDTTFRVRIQEPTQQAGRMRVISLVTGKILFDERYNAPAYGHSFDFRNMQDGQYMLAMHVGGSVYRYTVRVQREPEVSVALRNITVKTRLPKMSIASASL